MRHLKFIGTLTALLFPSLAFAHLTQTPADSFSGGFIHALSGVDHLAALWCLGAISALFAARALQPRVELRAQHNWVWLPGLFALGGAAGVGMGAVGASINPEPVIAGSIVFWAALLILTTHKLAAHKKLNFALHACASIFFALFHGLAHSALLTQVQQPLAFYTGLSLGFSLCFGAGFIATQHLTATRTRWAAGLISLVGLSGFFGLGHFI